MKKKLLALLCVLVLLVTAAGISGCRKDLKDNVTNYSMELEFDAENMTLKGKNTVSYLHRGENPVSEVYFQLHANGFRRDAEFKAVSTLYYQKAYPFGMSDGYIEVSAVQCNGVTANFSVGGEDSNVLIVPLLKELYPDERAKIVIEYLVKIPNCHHRLGYAEDTVNLGNFYPIAAVFEEGEFKCYPYYSNGDPFYSEVSNYQITLTMPKEYTAAMSGQMTEEETGSLKQVTASGTLMREFAIVLSKNFEVLEQEVNGVNVRLYTYRDERKEQNLQCAADAIRTYSEMFGAYPYPTYSVVKADFIYGGMEYPGLSLISDDVSEEYFLEVIAHETAHQWWYSCVGSNQVTCAWQDEGLAEYSTALFFEQNTQYNRSLDSFMKIQQEAYRVFTDVYEQIVGKVNTSMTRSTFEYGSELEYVTMAYNKGCMLFHEVRSAVGLDKFLKGCRKYYERYLYQNATPAQLIGAMEAGSGVKLSALFESFLDGNTLL